VRNTILIGLAGLILVILVSRIALLPAPVGTPSPAREPAVGPQTSGAGPDSAARAPAVVPSVPVGRTKQPLPPDGPNTAEADRQAAENASAEVQIALGDRYLAGDGVPVDPVEALRWYRAAAEQGSAAGQMKLGLMYEHGQGTAKDLDAAYEWYTKAAEQGDSAAQANLGDQFEFGDYISYKSAAYWYRLAANKGYVDAQLDLGRLYENGKGVDQDYRQAYVWYAVAAARGSGTAARSRDLVAAKLTPAEIADAERLAAEWRPKQPKSQKAAEP
jgi:TPR repeat protein